MKKTCKLLFLAACLGLFSPTPSSAVPVWGPAANTMIGASDNVVTTASLGADNGALGDWSFSTLTVSGGYLEADRLYGGLSAPQTISLSGGHVKVNLAILGYAFDTTFNQSGGIMETANGAPVLPGFMAIGRNAANTIYNMTGGQLLIGGDLYMPGNPFGNYGTPGVLNFSGGEIVIQGDDWSATGFNILGQTWFNDLGGNAQAVWDGTKTTISAVPDAGSTVALLGLGLTALAGLRRKFSAGPPA